MWAAGQEWEALLEPLEPGPELANQTTPVPPELFDSALETIAAIAIPR